jgi:mono/diheme cytochrome c family protein
MGYLPPKLDSAGRKLTTRWLEKILWGEGGDVRPYLTLRMPRFGEANAAPLVADLAEACQPAMPHEIDTSGTKGHQRSATGRTLMGAGDGGLGCVACHGLKEREAAGVRAVNLTPTAQRVQPEYFKALLLDPQGVQPGTIMPPLFAGRKNADKEIESLWTYLKELDQNPRLPEGLEAPGSFELKPEIAGRPIVFRTFLEGAGTHAIAVGFPARVHVAFDALEVRWALVWRGRFLDATSNWEERLMPPVKPLGEATRMLPTHPSLARLRAADEAWPATWGEAAGYSFRGYRLEADGTPVFRYAVNGLEIEDAVRPEPDGSLRRTLKARGGGDGWYFLGTGTGAKPQPVLWHDGGAIFEERIRF